MVNIRINIAPDVLGLKPKTILLIASLHMALRCLGAKAIIHETKIFKWQSGRYRTVTGFVAVPAARVNEFMKLSGANGIFPQISVLPCHTSAQHITSPPPTPWEHNQPPPKYHHQTERPKAGAHKKLSLGKRAWLKSSFPP